VVNEAHTPANAAGIVFEMVQPRMAAMWHCHVVEGYIDSVFEDVAKKYSGPVTLSQDLTVFNVTPGAVVTRQALINPVQQATIGPSDNEYALDGTPHPNPAWWADAAIDWQSMLT
jgi:hypothetical protein